MAEVAKIARVRAKRPTIAFFVNDLEGDYSGALVRGILDAAERRDVNLIVFPGQSLKTIVPNDYNQNIIYQYVNCSNIDGLILATTVLHGYASRDEFMAFYSRYRSLPVVSIGIPLEGVPSVLINNRSGFKQVLNHLIRDHHKRKIAFINGPEKHIDAQGRFLVYREVLEENGLEFNPDLVAQGDFTRASVNGAMKMLDERRLCYDAIAAANDIMAYEVLNVLRDRKISVPEQIAVTGFDDEGIAKHASPSLTTVKQPFYELTQKALEMVLELIQGQQLANVIFDTKMVIRESCGCLSETFQSFHCDSMDFRPEFTAQGALILNSSLDNFLDRNLEMNYSQRVKFPALKSLITDCLHALSQEGGEPGEADQLFGGFNTMLDIPNIEEDDINFILKTITTLKKWLGMDGENSPAPFQGRKGRVEEFFEKLWILIMEMAIKLQENQWDYHFYEILRLRGILVEMVSKIHNHHEQLSSIIPKLRAMRINNCYIYLYDQPVRYLHNDIWRNPPSVNMVVAYDDENIILKESPMRLTWEKVICNEYLPQKRYTLMLKPLYFQDEHLGLILMEFNMPHYHLFESLVIEMSCAIRLSLSFHEREQIDNRLREAVQELEEYNRKLKRVSQTDELTGLYNRRGFLDLATQRLNHAKQQGKGGLVFYGDMDGLKKINDQYGHDEGDIAIRAMAKILIKNFWATDIIARIGGDEFTIFTEDTHLDLLPKIKERLHKHIEEYNLQAGKPYQISITLGAVPFYSGEKLGPPITLDDLLNQADKMLYEAKKHKKRGVE